MEKIVEVNNVTKEYILYNGQLDRLKSVLGLNKKQKKLKALSSVSFEVDRGDVVGILGRNGSGKSTLLRILTKITHPNEGNVKINGTVALLQIGTGLLGDLTGIENIYLKGQMMGLSKKEIDFKKKDIIDFSELDSYINQPLKNYSSGMKARLGFAIAININPDILIIDEALAVGDEAFRLKCLNKIKEFKKQNKTILYVSHSRDSVLSFCNKAMWLNFGEMKYFGDVSNAVKQYDDFMNIQKKNNIVKNNKNNENIKQKTKKDYISLKKVTYSNGRIYKASDTITVTIEYIVKESLGELYYFIEILDDNSTILMCTLDLLDKDKMKLESTKGTHKIEISINEHGLHMGKYLLSVGAIDESGLIRVPLIFKNLIEITNSKIPKIKGVQK